MPACPNSTEVGYNNPTPGSNSPLQPLTGSTLPNVAAPAPLPYPQLLSVNAPPKTSPHVPLVPTPETPLSTHNTTNPLDQTTLSLLQDLPTEVINTITGRNSTDSQARSQF